jgi:anti-sigma factor RsiW
MINEEMLWDYVDGLLNSDEHRKVEDILLQQPEWQQQLAHIKAERALLKSIPNALPKAGFSDGVMAAWVAEQATAGVLVPASKQRDWVLYAITGAFGVFLIAPVLVMLATGLGIETAIPTSFSEAVPAAWQLTDVNLMALQSNTVLQIVLYLGGGLLLVKLIEKYLIARLFAHA